MRRASFALTHSYALFAVSCLVALACAGGGDDVRPRDTASVARSAPGATPADSATTEWWLEEDVPNPAHKLFSCIAADSAIYADLRPDPETGDTSGVLIALWRAGNGIDGAVATAVDPTHALPLTGVRLFAADSITLDMPHPDDVNEASRFVGRVNCDRLWGRQRAFRDSPTRPASYHRRFLY